MTIVPDSERAYYSLLPGADTFFLSKKRHGAPEAVKTSMEGIFGDLKFMA